MHTLRTGQGWKLLIAMLLGLTILFIFLVAVGASHPRINEGSHRGRLIRVQAETPNSDPQDGSSPNFLKDFVLVPGTAVLIDDHHVLALYQNPQKDFYALVLFRVDCKQASCTPTELLAFSIVDGEGRDVQLAKKLAPKNPEIAASI
ncbi:MAG TPA: hypothetical protein VGL70_22605 [Candidatus Binatia bacterium]|jgi:hypothetical protein